MGGVESEANMDLSEKSRDKVSQWISIIIINLFILQKDSDWPIYPRPISEVQYELRTLPLQSEISKVRKAMCHSCSVLKVLLHILLYVQGVWSCDYHLMIDALITVILWCHMIFIWHFRVDGKLLNNHLLNLIKILKVN